jgi:hypothetical protein
VTQPLLALEPDLAVMSARVILVEVLLMLLIWVTPTAAW